MVTVAFEADRSPVRRRVTGARDDPRMQMSRTLAADAESAGSEPGVAAWAWPAAALAIVAISLAPFLVVDVPAVMDYPNHLARFFILAHPHDPILSKMYAPHWTILPNIGMDVLGQALLSVLPPYVGGRIVLGLSLLAPLAGAALYARAAFGRWTWWSLGVGVVAYNGVFFLGFMNFLLGLGVGLAGAAAWRVLRRHGRDKTAALAGAAIGLGAFFCHLLGFGLFALLIVAQELEPLLVDLWRRRRISWRTAAYAAALLAVALAPTVLLYGLSHHPSDDGEVTGWNWAAKLTLWLLPFMIYSAPATLVTAAVVIGLAVLVWRGSRVATGAGLALAVVVAVYLVAPAAAEGVTFVDARLPPVAVLLLFAGVEPRPPRGAARMIAGALALLILGRAAIVAANWVGHARDLAELRAEFAYVPPGAKILPAWTGAPPGEETSGRELPHFMLLNDELAALAVIDRRAFWPLEFADPGQQPMVLRAPYDRIAQPVGWSAQWPRLYDAPPTPADIAEHPFLTDWRRRFDFVLLTGPRVPGPPPAGLALVRGGEATSLYRIVH
jgi:hypothetical protein